jgi:hypothetical protein
MLIYFPGLCFIIHVKWVPCRHDAVCSQVADGADVLKIYRGWLRIYCLNSSSMPTRGSVPAWCLGVGTQSFIVESCLLRTFYTTLGLYASAWETFEEYFKMVDGLRGLRWMEWPRIVSSRELRRRLYSLLGICVQMVRGH